MSSEAKTSLVINGVDRTGGAFASIGARAAAAGSQLKSVLGGALAAAGAYFGVRGIVSGIQELGHLSDIAQKTNTSVDDLTQTATAMNVLGIQNMGVEQFAKAMDYMQKTTGRVGMQGFYQTVEELAKIEDRAKRGQEAMKIFGRSGMEFMPLINGAEGGIQALQGVIDVMPRITDSAANSGDKVADAMNIASAGFKSIWLQALGAVCGWFDSMFVGGIREAALLGASYLEYYAKIGATKAAYWWGTMQNAMSEVGTGIGTFVGALAGGASVSEAWDMAKDQYKMERQANLESEADELASIEKRQEAWRAALAERNAKIAEFSENYANAAKSAPTADLNLGEEAAAGKAKKAPMIRNQLMLGESNDARKLSILGPQLQTETKKQTDLLKKIAKNTEKKDGDAVELEVLDK